MALLDEALWKRLSPLLDRALELSAEERSALIATLRGPEPELAAALEGALAAHDRASASGFLAPATGSPARSLAGQVLGSYRLVERIGSGGMGSVWRATRVDGRFEGEVAVKLLHPSLIEGEGAERFRREGTILSRLTHPGIARLYDAGVSEAGQPYLVLELVDGERIDRHADAQRLDVEARLILFLQVAEAVAQAHASLVVHRDLKPSNILVDRDGRVKLLDFGIATLLDAASGEASRRTQTVARALTPQYAAPEQLEGGAITTATDVYALGILLYELLTGAHPSGRADTSPAELLRAITDAAPSRMSERVRRVVAEEDGVDRFAARATTRERLARTLAGDLDTIVAKALKKPAGERYPTVTALAEDVARYLADLPVRARPDRFGYRLRKLVVRRRLEVSAAAFAAVALLGATVISWRQARASGDERDRALEELRRAEITNDLSGFLLAEAGSDDRPISKTDLLARAEAMIEGRFADEPALGAHSLLVLSDRFYEVSDFEGWKRVLARAYELASRTEDTRLRAAAGCELALSISDIDPERTRQLLSDADRALSDRRVAATAAAELARCRFSEALIASWNGDLDRTIEMAQESLRYERSRPGPPGRGANALNTLALAQSQLGRFEEASRSFEELFALLEAARRTRSHDAVVYRHNWALALSGAGQARRALAEEERVVTLARELGGDARVPPHALWTYASLLSLAGRHGEAVDAVDRAVDKGRSTYGLSTPFFALGFAARVYAEAGRFEEAASRLAELDRVLAATAEVQSRYRGLREVFGAAVDAERGDAGAALAAARRAIAIFEREERPERDLLGALLLAARAANDSGDAAAAAAYATRALDVAERRRGGFSHSRDVGLAELEAARAAARSGELPGGPAAIGRAVEQLREAVGEEAPETRRARAVAERID
ncbi:MAG: hypothetical protein AMXMBFR36_31550 [Acidobacteriota bacterium]